MKSLRRTAVAGLVLGAMLTCASAAHAVDRAIVVGVNSYPRLGTGARHPDLDGCINDANAMAEALKKYGFQVTLLTEKKAKKASITNAIQSIGPTDRFVFYFAGHGTTVYGRGTSPLPHDAEEQSIRNDLETVEFNQMVHRVPAKTRTVILDCSFTGGMKVSSRGLGPNRKYRRYHRYHTFSPLAGRDENGFALPASEAYAGQPLIQSKPQDSEAPDAICYYTATHAQELATESDFDGVRRGVFSYYLASWLDGGKTQWQLLHSKVATQVADYMRDEQHPTLSPGFLSSTIFDAAIAQTFDAGSEDPWHKYGAGTINFNLLKMELAPAQTQFKIGDNLRFEVMTGRAGYLVLIEKGTSGRYNLLWPATPNLDQSKSDADKTIRIPEIGFDWQASEAGVERVRAILFAEDDRERAIELLNVFKDKEGMPQLNVTPDEAQHRLFPHTADLSRNGELPAGSYWTADIAFRVVANDLQN